MLYRRFLLYFFFFFNDTATTEIYTLSLHDALPISYILIIAACVLFCKTCLLLTRTCQLPRRLIQGKGLVGDRKSTRLNSSHSQISYAVFCLKKKKKSNLPIYPTTLTSPTRD